MYSSRQEVCARASQRLAEAAPRLSTLSAVVGFDGFVDEIIAVVDKRYDDDRFEPVRTIAAMAAKVHEAEGESSNYELVVKQRKLGGNGPIMANALACLGLRVTYIGCLGHPVFHDFALRAEAVGIAEPGHTDALEFDDGKLMFGKYERLGDVNWNNLIDRVGRDQLTERLGAASLIGMVNWTMLPGMSLIWERLIEEVFPVLERNARTLFIDLADPEKRTREDLRAALGLLTRFQEHVEVILGLNLKEAVQVAAVLGLPPRHDPEATILDDAEAIRRALEVGCVVIHPRRAAAAATATRTALFEGPFVQHPMISTGAGDHFNAGFVLGRILGLDLEASLCAGVAASGFYVRTAQSPTAEQLAAFIASLPDPEPTT